MAPSSNGLITVDRPPIQCTQQCPGCILGCAQCRAYEYLPDYDGERNPWPRTPYPDAREYSYRDYGNRVGFWRMTEVLTPVRRCVCNFGGTGTEIAKAMVERDWDFMSHGIYNTRSMTTYSSKSGILVDCVETLERHTVKSLKGMRGRDFGRRPRRI